MSDIIVELETSILEAARNRTDNLDTLLQEAAEIISKDQWNRIADKALQILTEKMRDLRGWKDDEDA